MVAAAMAATAAVGAYSSNRAASAQRKAAGQASSAQEAASMAAIEEQRRQFDAMQELQRPFVNAGMGALQGQQDLLGLNGSQAQQNAINGIQNSAEFQTYLNQGENSLRQNASATGGLRGGNMQGALAQFSPQLLNQMINQRYTNLGGLTALGQNSAAGVGNAGMQSANNIGNLLQQMGAAQAGNSLAQGNASANQWAAIGNIAGQLGGMYAGSKF
ncbi:hypothetical protein [Acinetobacter sp. ESBL14]|uniref:hypothetical protein n=1 Tax=Acinetobacter sp. ESBL14 TaxID=3077329 RepID=UPI002FC7D65A